MNTIQSGILELIPSAAHYLTFTTHQGMDPAEILRTLAETVDGIHIVIGLGPSLVRMQGGAIQPLHGFPAFPDAPIAVPSTPTDLLCWIRGEDRGKLVLEADTIQAKLAPAFECISNLATFRHDIGRDLTGYEDGTENPTDDEAVEAAFLLDAAEGLAGSSFMAMQQWKHDLQLFNALPTAEQDTIMGRHIRDNSEMEDAQKTSHIKRTDQESFTPEATLLRRSMPWSDADGYGLNFVGFGKDFSAFEAQLNRMVGGEDGIIDALFRFSCPLNGSYFWCPPMHNGHLDLRAIGL
jgi:putative iron-dependent peroxidase